MGSVREIVEAPVVGSSPYYQPDGRVSQSWWDGSYLRYDAAADKRDANKLQNIIASPQAFPRPSGATAVPTPAGGNSVPGPQSPASATTNPAGSDGVPDKLQAAEEPMAAQAAGGSEQGSSTSLAVGDGVPVKPQPVAENVSDRVLVKPQPAAEPASDGVPVKPQPAAETISGGMPQPAAEPASDGVPVKPQPAPETISGGMPQPAAEPASDGVPVKPQPAAETISGGMPQPAAEPASDAVPVKPQPAAENISDAVPQPAAEPAGDGVPVKPQPAAEPAAAPPSGSESACPQPASDEVHPASPETAGLLQEGDGQYGADRFGWWARVAAGLKEGNRFDDDRIDEYRDELFDTLDDWMGATDPNFKERIDHAMFVRTKLAVDRGIFYRLFCLCTFGIFLLFKRDAATALLVLTKNGRVILVNSSPIGTLGTGGSFTKAGIIWYLGLLVLVTTAPIAILFAISPQLAQGTLFRDILLFQGTDAEEVDDVGSSILYHLRDKIREKAIWYYIGVAVCWVIFIGWLFRHRQRGYSDRAFREFKAQSVSNAQYALEHSHLRPTTCTRMKMGKIRFFFGRYAGKSEMDADLPPSCPEASTLISLPRVSDGSEGMSLNQRDNDTSRSSENARESRSSGPCLSFVLLFFSSLTQMLVIYSVATEAVNAYKARSFCDTATGPDECVLEKCANFVVEEHLSSHKFCEAIEWLGNATDLQHQTICSLAGRNAPCCAPCLESELFWWLGGDDPGAWAQTASQFLSLLVLFLALAVSRNAAVMQFGHKTETNCLEVEFVENFANPDKPTFLLNEELALGFLDRVFRVAGAAFEKEQHPRRESMHSELRTLEAEAGGSDEYVPEYDHESRNWHDRMQSRKRLADMRGRLCDRGYEVASVPAKCLGLIDAGESGREEVVSAWAEMPRVTYSRLLTYTVLAAFIGFMLIFWPEQHGGSLIHLQECRLPEKDEVNDRSTLLRKFMCNVYRFLLVALFTTLCTPVLIAIRHHIALELETTVIIVTNERIYAVYQNWGVSRLISVCLGCCCCDPALALRVDVFRHGDGIYYGRMTTKVPLWFDRIFNSSFEPGDVIGQSIFGIFKIERRYGNVEKIYNLVSRVLSRDVPDLQIGQNYNFKCYGIEEEEDGKPRMGIDEDGFWWVPEEKQRPADGMLFLRDCHIANTNGKLEETPLFVWSFVEKGKITSPFDAYNDIIVTTDRVRLHSQVYWKFFDCRSCCCWGACWCFCLRRYLWKMLGNAQLPKSRSFLNFTHLVSFATEITVKPSYVWLKIPCYLFCCNACTACVHCQRSMCPERSSCCGRLKEEPPKVQLWLLFLQKWAQSVQADMVLSVRPYKLPEPDPDARVRNIHIHNDSNEVRDLRELMRVVLQKKEEQRKKDEEEEEPPPE